MNSDLQKAEDDLNSGDPCQVRSITLDLGGDILICIEKYGDMSIEDIEKRMSWDYRPFEDEIIIHNVISDCMTDKEEGVTYYVLDESDLPVQATFNGVILEVDDDDVFRAVFKSVESKGNQVVNSKGQRLGIKKEYYY